MRILPLTTAVVSLAVAGCGSAGTPLHTAFDAAVDTAPIAVDASVDAVVPMDAPTIDLPAADGPVGDEVDWNVTGDGGVLFRVWAPAASAATVVGDFGSFPMALQPGGVFTVTLPEAQPGQQYHYELQNGAATLTRIDPRARQVVDGGTVIPSAVPYPWVSNAFTAPALRDTVIYELHVGSFNVLPGATNGTYASVAAKLDDLADLGINAIELMPVPEFDGVGWGYNPKLWFAPNPEYGTPDDLRALIDAAHGHGIAVLLDVVYNHYTGGHTSPLYCFDGNCPGTSDGPYFFQPGTYETTPWGPRPDYSQSEVANAIVDSVDTWLTEYRADGFRWDSVSNIRAINGTGSVPDGEALLQRANTLAHGVRPGVLEIAEDLKGYGAITNPIAAGGFGFDAQWDGFVYTLGGVIAPASDAGRDMNAVNGVVLGNYNGNPFERVIDTENHDTVGNGGARLPSQIDAMNPGSFAARKRTMLAAGILLTSPGIPMLFMGQENLTPGTFLDPPTALDWSYATTYPLVRSFFKTLIGLRRNLAGTTAGLEGANVQVIQLNPTNHVIAYRRWDVAGDDVVVLANFANRAFTTYNIGLPAGGTWYVRLDTDSPQWSTDFTGTAPATVEAVNHPYDNQAFTGPIVLGPWSVVVLSRVPAA